MINFSKILGVLLLLCLHISLDAQITITNATFPAAGDTLKTASDLSPEGVMIPAAGGPFSLNYSTLQADTRSQSVFQPASAGMAFGSFPQAELVVILDAGAETYYDVSATAFSNLGFSSAEVLTGIPFDANLKFIPPLKERQAPIDYPSLFNNESALSIAIPLADLPDGILDSFGIPSGLVDSIGVQLTTTRADFTDAFGTLTIPGGTYDVLRIKRTDYSDTRLRVYNALLGWQDITDLFPVPGFGQDTTISYHYINDVEKEPIAVVTMDSTGMVPVQVEFKDNGITNHTADAGYTEIDIILYPNPVVDQITISFQQPVSKACILHIYDATGRLVLVKRNLEHLEEIPFAEQAEGFYAYHIFDQNGKHIAGGQFLKVQR